MYQTPPQQVAKLLELAKDYATNQLRTSTAVGPMFFYPRANRIAAAASPGFEDQRAKRHFLDCLRLIAISEGVTAGVLVLDCWLAPSRTTLPKATITGPAKPHESDRGVLILLETRETRAGKLMPVLRRPDGSFAGFGEALDIQELNLRASFTRILPQREPDTQTRRNAAAILKRMGASHLKGDEGMAP